VRDDKGGRAEEIIPIFVRHSVINLPGHE